jgi:hypothetical protein
MSQFSSLSRRGNYAYAGKVAANDALKAFIQQKRNSPDMGQLVLDAEKIKAKERLNAINRTKETFNTIANIEADSKINKIKTEADQNFTKSKRFAGVLGAAGQLVSGGANKLYDARNRDTDVDNSSLTYYDNQINKTTNKIQEDRDLIDSLSKVSETPTENNSSTSTQTTPSALEPTTPQSFKFTPVQAKGLSEIRRVESGPFGYNAYNLGGKTEFEPIGSPHDEGALPRVAQLLLVDYFQFEISYVQMLVDLILLHSLPTALELIAYHLVFLVLMFHL